jgi:hypothetical protein
VRYRVPVKHTITKTARNKAVFHYAMVGLGAGKYRYEGAPGAVWVEFEAKTHAEAQRVLQRLVRPGDPRPIMGWTMVKVFALKGELGQS